MMRWRSHPALPTVLRLGAVAVALVLAGFLVVWGIDLGRRIGGLGGPSAPSLRQQLQTAQGELARVQAERDQLAAALEKSAAAAKAGKLPEEKPAVAGPAQEQSTSQIKALEFENGKLVEDLADVTRLIPAARASRGLAIRRLEAGMAAPNVLHYRLLLTQAGELGQAALPGRLQLLLTVAQGGKLMLLSYPDAAAANAPQFVLKLGQFQRCEGTLALPDGVTVKSIQARVLEKGQVRSSQSVTVKDAPHVRS